jgi:cell division protein FtsL
MISRARTFLVLWIMAIVATCAAFVLYLALRVRSVELGYELGRAHAKVARLREVKRVLELELASHKTPERVDLVARTLLGMSEPTPERILSAGKPPEAEPEPAAAPASSAAPPAGEPAPSTDDDPLAGGEEP